MRRELREWGWMALGFSACLLIAGIGAVIWGNHIEHRIDRVVIGRHHDHRELRRVTAALGGTRQVQADPKHVEGSEVGQPVGSVPSPDGSSGPVAEHVGAGQHHAVDAPTPAGAPTAPSPAPVPASSQPAQPIEAQGPPAAEPAAPNAPGLLGNPGGAVGEVLCSVNALGIRICTE